MRASPAKKQSFCQHEIFVVNNTDHAIFYSLDRETWVRLNRQNFTKILSLDLLEPSVKAAKPIQTRITKTEKVLIMEVY